MAELPAKVRPIIVSNFTQGVWAVSFANGSLLVLLDQCGNRVRLTFRARQIMRRKKKTDPKPEDRLEVWTVEPPSASEAIEFMRSKIRELDKPYCTAWEALRGARSDDEFVDLIKTMPGIEWARPR